MLLDVVTVIQTKGVRLQSFREAESWPDMTAAEVRVKRRTCSPDLEEVHPISGASCGEEGEGSWAGAGGPGMDRDDSAAAAGWRDTACSHVLCLHLRCCRESQSRSTNGRSI